MFSKPKDPIVHVEPLVSVTTGATDRYRPAGYTITTSEKHPHSQSTNGDARPILRRDNTGLQTFLNDIPADSNIGYDGEVDTLKLLGRFYTKVMTFSVFTRYAFYILPVSIILGIPLIIFATVKNHATAGGVKLMGLFVWLEIIWCSLWVAKLCSKALPPIFRFLCGVMSAGTRKHSLLIKALEVPISIVVWTITAWSTIPVITAFNPSSQHASVSDSQFHWIRIMQRIFLASIPVACIFLVEKTIIQFITVNYHRTQFSARIAESKRLMHLFELLYEASSILHPPYCAKFANEDYTINSSILSEVGKGIQEVTALQMDSPTRIFDDIGRLGNGVTSIFGNIVSEVTGTERTDAKSAHSVVSWALERKAGSEALARRVFYSLVGEGHDALYVEDIEKVLGANNEREVEEIFGALDKDGNGDVSLAEMTMMVIELGQGRQAMAMSLHDVDRAIKALDRVLLCGVLIGAGMIYGTFFSADFFKQLSVYTTSLMSFSFAFAVTVQEFTGSCIFLFVKHPYDVSDRVEINNVDLIVEHISLLYTIFRRVDSNRTVQIPNIVNAANWIENITRSRSMSEQFTLSISAGTSFEEIEALHDALKIFVSAPENKRDFKPDVKVDLFNVGDLGKLDLKINLGYKSNWSNEALRISRRSKFLCALLATLREVQINAPGGGDVAIGDAARPAYSVSLTEEEGKLARARWVEEKEKNKFVKDKDI